VKKLIENGRRYRKLEAEYARLVTEASLDALKNGRRRLTLPRPRLVSVISLLDSIERAHAKERRKVLPHLDENLAKAVSKDMSAYMGEVMSSVAFRSNAPKVRS